MEAQRGAEGTHMAGADRAGSPARDDRSLRLLHLLQRSAVASNEADRVEDAIARVLADLCEVLDWQVGHAWLRAEDGSEGLEPTGVWYLETPERFAALRAATPTGRIEPEPVLRPFLFAKAPLLWGIAVDETPPRVRLSSGRTIPVEEMAWPRMLVAWECGLRSFFLIPIRSRDETLGVLEVGATRSETIDDELVESIGQVGTQLGRVLERERAARALRQREEHLRGVLGALVDTPVVIANRAGQIVESFGALVAIRGLSTAEVLAKAPAQWLAAGDLVPLLDALEQVFASGRPQRLERRLDTRRGSSWLDLRLYPLRDASGGVESVLCLTYDLTDRKRLEDEVHESERRYQVLADVAPVGIYRTDAAGGCVYVNRHACAITGRSREELLGRGWASTLHAEDRERIIAGHLAARLSGRSYRVEFPQPRPDGSTAWVMLQASPESDPPNSCMIGTLTDITDLKRLQDALRESERVASRLAEISPVGIFRLDPRGRAIYVNDRLREISGATSEEAGTEGWRARLDDPDDPGPRAADAAIRSGCGFASLMTFRRPDGTRVSALSQAAPDRDESGRLRGFVGTLTDVTELRRMDAALRESERVASRLAEVSPVGIFRTDAAGRPIYANERCYEITGLRPSDLGRAALLWPRSERTEETDAFRDAGLRAREQAAPFDEEVRFLRADGTPAWAVVQALPDFDEVGSFVGHVGTITEITERRLVAEELARHRDRLGELVAERTAELERTHERLRESERLAAVGTFAAGIAHQINNPVGGILLAAQYAKNRAQDPGTVSMALDHIVADARRCGRIVRGVLEFARGDVGERKPCDLNAIVRDACDQVGYEAAEREAEIDLALAEALPELHGSASSLDQVVTNLLQNALEAGARRVLVSTAWSADGFAVEIADDGRGIAVEDLDLVVAPFFTTRRGRGGTGLGLTLAHGIVRAHGGRLEVASDVGRGTTVRVHLPGAGVA